jgi:hypothetical protein
MKKVLPLFAINMLVCAAVCYFWYWRHDARVVLTLGMVGFFPGLWDLIHALRLWRDRAKGY